MERKELARYQLKDKILWMIIENSGMIATALIIRWLYGISSPKKDYMSLKIIIIDIEAYIEHLKWYRYFEWKRQIEAKRIIENKQILKDTKLQTKEIIEEVRRMLEE